MADKSFRPSNTAVVIDLPLKGSGGGGTYDDMEIVDAKIAAAEARTDAKFAEVLGELKAMRAELSHMPSTPAMIGTMGGFSALAIGILLTVLAFGGDRFDGGVAVGQAGAEAKAALERVISNNEAQTRQIEKLSQQMQQVIMALSPQGGDKSQPELQFQFPMHRDGSN